MNLELKFNIKLDPELIVMSILALIIAITSIEVLFRSNEEAPPTPVLGLSEEFCPHPDYFDGARDNAGFRLQVNDIRRYQIKGYEKVFVLGGSATEAYYLSEHERWPFMLRDRFLENGKKLEFVNVAHSGSTSFQHVRDLKAVCDSFPTSNKIIVNLGVADMLFVLSGRSYSSLGGSILDHSAIFRDRSLIVDVEERKTKGRHSDFSPVGYIQRRENRRNGTLIRTLPDVDSELDDYEDNIIDLIEMAEEREKTITFVTQPFLWKKDLSELEQKLLWTGGYFEDDEFETNQYYDAAVLAEAMQLFNERLIATCAQHNVPCVDLDAKMEKNTRIFFDGYHMHESGHYLASNILYQQLEY